MSLIKSFQKPRLLDSWVREYFNSIPSLFNGLPLATASVPSVNIKETESEYVMEIAAPGFEKDNIKLEVKDNVLYVSGEWKKENAVDEENYVLREFNYSGFSRSFALPKDVNQNDVRAEYKQGVLNIRLAKQKGAAESSVKSISIL